MPNPEEAVRAVLEVPVLLQADLPIVHPVRLPVDLVIAHPVPQALPEVPVTVLPANLLTAVQAVLPIAARVRIIQLQTGQLIPVQASRIILLQAINTAITTQISLE